MSPYKIIIADDHEVVRTGAKTIIEKDPELKIIAEAANGEELITALKSNKCDVVMVDISMPEMDGLTAIKKIKSSYPKLKILILSMLKDYQHFHEAMSHGASGYIVKDDFGEQISTAIKTVLRGKKYISPSVTTMLADRQIRSLDDGEIPSLEILTKREKQVLELIAKGYANKNIAVKLKISPYTVKNHRLNLSDKLGLKTTAALVKFAISKGLA